ncbi:hypothetical protein HWV62_811 [Athelia sp. TMB]|nr:hypothetical protein HWV62_811 [Athelia sp. TMB]
MILRPRAQKRRRSESSRSNSRPLDSKQRGSVNIKDEVEETGLCLGSPEVDELDPVPDSAQAAKPVRRGPGVRSPRKDQPNECTTPGCTASLTVEDKEQRLVNCAVHRSLHNRAKRKSKLNKRQKLSTDSTTGVPPDAAADDLDQSAKVHRAARKSRSKNKEKLSTDSTTAVPPDVVDDNLDQFAEDIANSVAASLFRNNGLNLHKEILVKSQGATVNSQGSAFVRNLGLKLGKWAPATIMRQVLYKYTDAL